MPRLEAALRILIRGKNKLVIPNPIASKEVSDFSINAPKSDPVFQLMTPIWRDGAMNDGPFRVNREGEFHRIFR